MFGFKKKKKKTTEDEIFDDLIGDINQIDSWDSDKKVEHYILDSCEQIISTTKDIEGKKAEIRVLSDCLDDIRKIEALPPKEASSVKKAAAAIEKAKKSRRSFIESPKSISDDAYRLIEENEDNIRLDIRRMKDNEKYQENVSARVHVLEADKGELRLDFDEATAHTSFARKICILLLVLFVASFVMLIAAQGSSSGGSVIAGIFLLVFGLLAVLLFLWQASTIRRRKALLRNLNTTIGNLNVARMEYVSVTRAINATSDKYHIHSASELEYMYQSYLDYNDRRERFVKDDQDLTYWNSYLLRLLEPLELSDPEIWLSQAAAINHEEDMKAVRDELIQKRKDVRAQIEEEREEVRSDRDQIDRMMKKSDFYVPEIIEIIKSVDRLCGLDRNDKVEENIRDASDDDGSEDTRKEENE